VVTGLADASCNIIFGAVVDDAYEGIINVTIIGGCSYHCSCHSLRARKMEGLNHE
jgi:cell division GTPase FtsZ